MKCKPFGGGIICQGRVDFQCPYCQKKYNDADEKYYKRLQGKNWIRIKCKCGEVFGLAVDYTGDIVSFVKGL